MSKSIEAGRAVLKLLLDDKELNDKFAKVQRKMRNVGRSITSAGLAIGSAGGAITAPLSLAILKAAEAQEVFSKFDTVFGDNKKEVKAWGDEFAKQVGRSKVETAKFLASFQDLLVPVGFEPGAAEDFSKQLVTLATDLASFNNMQDDDVIRDLQAALTGSGEVMKKYGVIVSAAAVNQELLNMKLDPKSATEVEKAMARMNIIMKGTTAAQGDAIRTSDSFTNKMKSLQSQISDAAVEIGTVFLPAATDMLGWLTGAVQKAAKFVAENRTLIKVVGSVGIALTVLGGTLAIAGVAISTIALGIGGITKAIGFLRVGFTLLATHPIVAALLLIGGVVAWLTDGFGLFSKSVEESGESLDKVTGIKKDGPKSIAERGAQLSKENQALIDQLEEQISATAIVTNQSPAKSNETDRSILKAVRGTEDAVLRVLDAIRSGDGFIAGGA